MDRDEDRIAASAEGQRGVRVPDLDLGVAPVEPQDVMGGNLFGAAMRRVMEVDQRTVVVGSPDRPAGDLPVRERVVRPLAGVRREPEPMPLEEDAAVRDERLRASSDDLFIGVELGLEIGVPFSLAPSVSLHRFEAQPSPGSAVIRDPV